MADADRLPGATAQSPRPEPSAPIPSATVMVLRDAPMGLEVFMLVRNRQVDFASGALVFPGGKVDAQDRMPAWEALAPLAATWPARDYWVAALRETFEETGLLIAHARGTDALVDAATARRITAAAQTSVAAGTQRFADLVVAENLRIGTEHMVPFAHWVTPERMPKRFDTHFFLAHAPVGQDAIHDGGETVESAWLSPGAAIAEAEAGRRVLVPATQLVLEKLAKAQTVADAFARARSEPIITITPVVTKAEGGVVVSIPAGCGYDTTSVFVPRPSPA